SVVHEPVHLTLARAIAMRDLLLVGAKRGELTAGVDHLQHAVDTDRAHELILEVAHADEEAGAERPLERASLAFVAEADGARAIGQGREDAPDRLRAADRHDRDALRHEVAAEPRRERTHGDLVARSLDEDHA